MKRRIEQLLNGKFEYETKAPVLSEEDIHAECKPGDILTGSFDVSGPDGGRVKGFLYSSSPRVIFDPSQFSGAHSRITYQFDSTGLSGGDEVEGMFTLCTDRGEAALPYQFTVCVEEQEEIPKAPSPEELLAMSRRDISAARATLTAPAYGRYLEVNDRAHHLLYRSVVRQDQGGRSLEEYLIGADCKEPVELSVDEQTVVMEAPAGSESRTVKIQKSSWGYLEIHLESDAPFLRVEKKNLTTDEFVGDTYEAEYIVDRRYLHRGRNFGRIHISTCYQTIYLDVEVDCAVMGAEQMRQSRVQKIMRAKMLGLYVDLRTKRIEMQAWIDRSINVISSYRRSGGESPFADLFMVQLYFADGKKVKGYRLLQEIGKNPACTQDEEAYGFYLYLTTFFEREAQYVDEVERRIRKMQLRRRDSWILQWILLYLDEDYLKDDEKKIEAIRRQAEYGCASPIMYLEAAAIYRRNPYLLRTLDLFARKILLYASRQDMLTDELASHVGNLALQGETYEPKLFTILKRCYEVTQSPDCLRAICSVLIGADKKEPEYFHWYALAVQSDVRVTGLYEYYMETMDTVGIEKMPQIIRMYFSYDNKLSYHKKAAIYRDISDNRDNVPQVYRQNRPAIEHFITEQLSMGRIDRDLAVLYERFITRKMLTPSLADHLVRLLFTFEVTCKNPRMKSVIVVHEQLKGEQQVMLSGGRARVQIYTQDARIFLADENDCRYASPSLYMAERYLDSPLLITYCREILPDHPSLTLYFTGKGEKATSLTLPSFKRAEQMEELTDRFRSFCRRQILDYYRENPLEDDAYTFLKEIRSREYMQDTGKTLIELLAREGLYEEAAALLETYGSEHLDVQCLVRVCSQSVLLREYDEDETLLAYCYQCYAGGKYDDNILTYLLMYYDGPIEQMKQLWATGRSAQMDTMTLEEKILSLVLFTRTGSEGTEQIYDSYRRSLGRRKICRAYVILKAYEYLVHHIEVDELIFVQIEQSAAQHEEMEDVCALALLRYYSALGQLSEERRQLAGQLLAAYSQRGLRFAFYRDLPRSLRVPCQIDERVFAEYTADPAHTLVLNYRMQGTEAFQREEMKNVFEGIFVREFILFDGEVVEYYAEEFEEGRCVRTGSMHELCGAVPVEEDNSRYALLYRMSRKAHQGDEDGLRNDLDSYRQLDMLTDKIFTLV